VALSLKENHREGQGGLHLRTNNDSARKLAYYDSDYIQTLNQLLLGTSARDDIPITIEGTWEALGTAETTSPTSSFLVSNFSSNFNMYWINISGATASGTTSNFSLRLSTDNGVTEITSSNYYYQYRDQSSGSGDGTASAINANAISLGVSLQTSAVKFWTNLFLWEPMNSDLETQLWHNSYAFRHTNPFNATFSKGRGAYTVLEAHNAILINVGGGRTWTSGTVNVWGQAVPS